MLMILDRDGVINYESAAYIKSPSEWIPIPGSLEAIARLTAASHTVVVATNQSGVGRGYYSMEMLQKIHNRMQECLKVLNGRIEKIYVCPHAPHEGCECRKPKPGLLKAIAIDYPEEIKHAIFIGDSWRDVEAARAVGCRMALVKTGNGEKTIQEMSLDGVNIYEDLSAFVDSFLNSE